MHIVASAEEFKDRIRLAKAGNSLVVVDYFAPWCHACKSLHPQLQKLATAYQDVTFLSVSHVCPVDSLECLRLQPLGHTYDHPVVSLLSCFCAGERRGR